MKFKFCPECGYKFEKKCKFCPECGYKLTDNSSNAVKKEENDVFGGDFSQMESLFDEQLKKKDAQDKIYLNKLKKAKVLALEEKYDEAEKIYNEILDQEPLDINAYAGLLRISSKNYTEFYNERIEKDIGIISDLFTREQIAACPEMRFSDFVNAIQDRKDQAERLEKQRKLEAEKARKEREEQERIRKENELREQEARKRKEEQLEKERKAAEERARLRREQEEQKAKFLENVANGGDFEMGWFLRRVGKKMFIRSGEWNIIAEDDNRRRIMLMWAKPYAEIMSATEVKELLKEFKWKSGVDYYDKLLVGEEWLPGWCEKVPAPLFRVLNPYEYKTFTPVINSLPGNSKLWVYPEMPEKRKFSQYADFGVYGSRTYFYYDKKTIKPIIVIDKTKLIEAAEEFVKKDYDRFMQQKAERNKK